MHYYERRHHRARVVRDALRTGVLDGVWAGGVLPSEQELVGQFGVGRNVVREALQLLVEEGFLARQQGVGTSPRQRVQILGRNRLNSFHETQAEGEPAVSDVLQWTERPASALYASSLETNIGAPVILFERLMRIDEPLVFWSNVLRGDLGLQPPPPTTKTMNVGLFRFLENQGVAIGSSSIRTSAVAADRGVAEMLAIKVGTPVLVEHHRIRRADGVPACISTGYFRADRLNLAADIER